MRRQVYVASVADSAMPAQVKVSRDYGFAPAFPRAEDELFYVGEDGWMHAVRYESDPHFSVIERNRLFDAARYRVPDMGAPHAYDVSSDGRRFVMVPWAQAEPHELVLALNQVETLRR